MTIDSHKENSHKKATRQNQTKRHFDTAGKTTRKPIDPKDNAANMPNANKGTDGTNKQYDKNQGNRGKQIQQGKK